MLVAIALGWKRGRWGVWRGRARALVVVIRRRALVRRRVLGFIVYCLVGWLWV